MVSCDEVLTLVHLHAFPKSKRYCTLSYLAEIDSTRAHPELRMPRRAKHLKLEKRLE